ncbi:non-ribosomal peptide synthetase [Amycolatopsis magusensis]|uniref:Amino acid adenylation domain-containing protein n=1 Tax=Amycolatopsis magusensis TaxID=882444 RepID=A0ABS4PVS7_9PSEU|nr:non-ribosomal peptide synthetase [Amycolatopsis magusensis]MBP2182948.1 amino acid adenylation domain-containing protein [Amycolatopsis magusensis]
MTQERFWFVDQLRPNTSLHNLAFGMDIVGALDTAAVEWALTGIVRRHDVLRTRFSVRHGLLTQRFPPLVEGVLSRHEVTGPDQLERLTTSIAHEPFDYHSESLVRVALVDGPAERHRLVLVVHHAIFDGWSLGVFLAEFGELYRSRVAGRPAALPDLDNQYGDYAVWQRAEHDSGAFDADVAYWVGQLGDGCPPLELATDFPRPTRQRMRGRAHRFTIDAEVADRVRTIAAGEAATPFMAWLALFQLLLWRQSGQPDFCIGGPVSNRHDERWERLLGPFINVLAFRTDLSGDPTFRELLARVRKTVSDALVHQQLPLQSLTDRLAARPGGDGGPLFRVALAFQPFTGFDFELADGLSVRTFPVDVDHAQQDLSLFLTPGPAEIDAMVQYDTDLFRQDTIEQLFADFQTMARQLTLDPDLPIARLRATASGHQEPADRAQLFPLARQQPRWWSAERECPGDPAWKIATIERGVFDKAALGAAVRRLEQRNEVLRTRVCLVDGEPRLRVTAPGDLVLREHARGTDRNPDAVVATVLSTPVDLTVHPPVTVDLIPDGDEFILLVASHRFAVDEPSHRLLLRDLLAGQADRGKGPEFVDYALRQRRRLTGARMARLETYWRDVLAGATPVAGLAPRAKTPSTHATGLPVSAPVEQVDALCRKENLPLQPAVIAGLAVALQRYTHQQDLVLGVHAPDPESDGTVGCFADVLPVRVVVRPHDTFRGLVTQTAERYLGALEHRDVPLGLAPAITATVRVTDSPASDVTEVVTSAPFEVTFDVSASGGRLEGTVWCQADVVAAPRFGGSLEHLLAELGARPDRPIAEIPTLPPGEYRAVLGALAQPDFEAVDATLHGRFEECATRTPLAPALSDLGRQWTYRELNEWANRIAHGLIGSGVLAEQPVVLLMRNGPVAVAALLGVLKAGAMFVCLDPSSPADRIMKTLAGVDPALVVLDLATAAEHASTLPARVLVLAEDASDTNTPFTVHDFADQSPADPARGVTPGDLAYLAFTSGSTGVPKGIPHRHRDLVQFAQWQSDQFAIGPGLRLGQLASLSFDVAYCEIFGALCHGATLCTRPPSAPVDPAGIGEWLRDQRITLLQIIPGLFAEVLRALETRGRTERSLAELRTVLFVGEALPASLVRTLRDRFGDRVRAVNVYGPTEVVAATFNVVGHVRDDAATVPIGRPIPGRHLLLVDDTGHLCPPGVIGEIWIASRYLSDGYHCGAGQTGTRYTRSPFPEVPGVLYRTGDLAVLNQDGLLEFAGRTDNQVKLSGIRLELEDVESAVARHPHVRRCAARVFTHEGAQRLVAFVEADGPVDDLRDHLRSRVPAHMVPAEVVLSTSLPRNVNGKIDRTALPEPSAGGWPAAVGVAGRTPIERHLAELAAEVLGVADVSVTADLFDLGANSLQAARFVNRVDEFYGVTIPLQDLFDAPTVAAVAAAVEAGRRLLGQADRLSSIEQDLDGLSDDEIRILLARRRATPADTN